MYTSGRSGGGGRRRQGVVEDEDALWRPRVREKLKDEEEDSYTALLNTVIAIVKCYLQ